MLDLQKMGGRVWVKYSDDESYEISYFNDAQVRAEIGRDNSTFARYLATKNDAPVEEEEKEKVDVKPDPYVSALFSALFSTDFKVAAAIKSVTNWKGLYNGKTPLPCNDNNKKIIFETFASRADLIFNNCRDEKLFMGYSLGDDLKNLEPSSVTK